MREYLRETHVFIYRYKRGRYVYEEMKKGTTEERLERRTEQRGKEEERKSGGKIGKKRDPDARKESRGIRSNERGMRLRCVYIYSTSKRDT